MNIFTNVLLLLLLSSILTGHRENTPDMFRPTASNEQCWSTVGCIKAGKRHKNIQVCFDGVDVDPPAISVCLLYVGQHEVPYSNVLNREHLVNDTKFILL